MAQQSKRIVLINRDFQYRYMAIAIVFGAISTALTSIILLYPLYAFEILRIPNFLPTPVLLTMGTAAALNIIIIAVVTLYLSHKIAGPMFALARSMRAITQGNYNVHLSIRKKDELKYLVRNFNEMTQTLKRKAKCDFDRVSVIHDQLEEFISSKDQSFAEEAFRNLQALQKNLNKRLAESNGTEEQRNMEDGK